MEIRQLDISITNWCFRWARCARPHAPGCYCRYTPRLRDETTLRLRFTAQSDESLVQFIHWHKQLVYERNGRYVICVVIFSYIRNVNTCCSTTSSYFISEFLQKINELLRLLALRHTDPRLQNLHHPCYKSKHSLEARFELHLLYVYRCLFVRSIAATFTHFSGGWRIGH